MTVVMHILFWISVVICVLLLLGQISLGVFVKNTPDGLNISLLLGKIKLRVYPRKGKEEDEEASVEEPSKPKPAKVKKPKKTKEEKKKAAEIKKQQKKHKKKPELAETMAVAQSYLSLLLTSLERLGNFKTVEKLDLELVVGATDPVDAVLLYGQAHALLGTIWMPLDNALDIQKGRARVVLQFEETSPAIYGVFAVTLTINQILRLAIYMGLGIYQRTHKKTPKTSQDESDA